MSDNSETTRSTQASVGPLSFSICSFTMISKAMSGVKRPVRIPWIFLMANWISLLNCFSSHLICKKTDNQSSSWQPRTKLKDFSRTILVIFKGISILYAVSGKNFWCSWTKFRSDLSPRKNIFYQDIFNDFPGPLLKFKHFQVLENLALKFQDFPGQYNDIIPKRHLRQYKQNNKL